MINSPYAPQNNFGQSQQASNITGSTGSNVTAPTGARYTKQIQPYQSGSGGMQQGGALQGNSWAAPTNTGTAISSAMQPFQQNQQQGNFGWGTPNTQQPQQMNNQQVPLMNRQPQDQQMDQSAWQGIDPRLANLYQQHGIMTPGAAGSGFGDASYWNSKIGNDWNYINNRLGADLSGTGTDQPGPGDVGNLSGRQQQMSGGNQMMGPQQGIGPQDMQRIMQMMMQMRQDGQQAIPRNLGTSLAMGGYGPQQIQPMILQQQQSDISSFL